MSRWLISGAIVALAALSVLVTYWDYVVNPWTRDGQVRAQVIQVTPRVSGPIVDLPIVDNQWRRSIPCYSGRSNDTRAARPGPRRESWRAVPAPTAVGRATSCHFPRAAACCEVAQCSSLASSSTCSSRCP